jgi:hypothetical protein
VTLLGRPLGGFPAAKSEADDVRWADPHELDALDIHPTMRREIACYLNRTYPHID